MAPALSRIALLAAASAAAFAAALAAPRAARAGEEEAGPPGHPLFSSGSEDWMELRGGIEAGVRAVEGKEGRYAQDVNLDGGFRVLSASLEGTALEEGLWADDFSFKVRGVGDPDRHVSFSIRGEEAYDLRIHSDRQEYVFKATADPHPFDTVRWTDGFRLSFHAAKDLQVRLSSERIRREGDATLEQRYPDYVAFPVAATVDYDGLFQSAGFDGSTGALRYGASWSWGRAEDDSFRVLDRPDTPIPDLGRYRNRSEIGTTSAAGRLGLRLWKGKVDLSVFGTWEAAETDSRIVGHEDYSQPAAPFARSTDIRARMETTARGWSGRAELLLLPHPDWEVLARRESRTRSQIGDGIEWLRVQFPPFDPAAPYTPLPVFTRASADLDRTGAEVRWRASDAWRFRAGGEQVAERIREKDKDLRAWDPVTTAATAGADWTPSERFDASLLVREARARDPATQVSADEGRWLSLRLRARRPDGFHGTLFARVKQRTNDASDASAVYDSYGYAFGQAKAGAWFEISITREDYLFTSDTQFAQDASAPVKSSHRVRFDADVLAATLDMSQKVWGPVRLFGSARWADGSGGAPYVQSDASLGFGWRFVKAAELRLEGRRVAYVETNRNVDDYRARMVTLSVLYEF